jgi:arginase
MDARWSTLPYYFGGYNPEFERYAREDLSATIIRSAGAGLGAALSAARAAAPRFLIGGDCFTALPVIFARRSEIENVYWFDAHGDFHDEVTTSTGFLGGMPFAALTGKACGHLLEFLGEDPMDPARCKHVGGRVWDEGEKEQMEVAGVELLLTPPSYLDRPSHIHIDVDFLNVTEVPNVTHPAPGGPSTANMAAFLETNADWITSVTVSAWIVGTKPPAACVHLLEHLIRSLG